MSFSLDYLFLAFHFPPLQHHLLSLFHIPYSSNSIPYLTSQNSLEAWHAKTKLSYKSLNPCFPLNDCHGLATDGIPIHCGWCAVVGGLATVPLAWLLACPSQMRSWLSLPCDWEGPMAGR